MKREGSLSFLMIFTADKILKDSKKHNSKLSYDIGFVYRQTDMVKPVYKSKHSTGFTSMNILIGNE
jgi:hypothetical protein